MSHFFVIDMDQYKISHLRKLEAESIHIIREVVAEFKNPAMLYSIGKDSSVLVRLAEKAFFPGKIPFKFAHVDTGYKFPEMIQFRDEYCKKLDVDLVVQMDEMVGKAHPNKIGTDKCCGFLKTRALLDVIKNNEFDACFGGARRDEEKSRAKERIYSVRDNHGQWHPKSQRPELWDLYNSHIDMGENVRVFPISNWTELDVWNYIKLENIPLVPIYFAQKRKVIDRKGILIPYFEGETQLLEGEKVEEVECRFRSLGCSPCTGAIRSSAKDIDGIIKEVEDAKRSERENRIIDHGSDSAMEDKRSKGYF